LSNKYDTCNFTYNGNNKGEWRTPLSGKSHNIYICDGTIVSPVTTRRTHVQWDHQPRYRLVLDSGTDYPLAGCECLVVHRHDYYISFSGAIPGDPLHYKELVDVITWIVTSSGISKLVKIVGAVDNTNNTYQETLISPTHIRAGGHHVDDIQARHGGNEVIIANGIKLPLSSNGVHLYYKCHKPRQGDINKPHITLTQKVVFDPAQEAFKAKRQTKSTYNDKSLFRGSNDRLLHSNDQEELGSKRIFNSEKEKSQATNFNSEKEHHTKDKFNSENELSQKDTPVIGTNESSKKDTIATTKNELSAIRRKHVRFTDHYIAKAQEYETCLANHNDLIKNNINSPKGTSLISIPIKNLIGHKENNKIPKTSTPRRTFCLKRSLRNPEVGIYVALEDQWIDECSPPQKEELIAFWQKRLYLSRERTLATLRNTTQMVGLLHSEHARHLLNDFKKCRAPQLGSRRTPGTTYTDTAFASVTSWDGANAFQVFIHGTSSHLGIELMKSKRAVPSAIKNHSRKYGIPNHLHSDRAPEFLAGASLDYCLDQAIRVTTTGGKNKAHQNSRAEKMVGVIKGLTFRVLHDSGAPPIMWSYAMLYACKIWNSTSKSRLKDCTPNELRFGSTKDISEFRFPFYTHVQYWDDSPIFPESTGMRDGIYLGPAENEGDPFASYILNSATNRVVTRSIFREHCNGPTPLDNFTKKYAMPNSQFGIYLDEALTLPIPDAGEEHIPTAIDESCSFAVDTRHLSAQPNCIDLLRDDELVNASTTPINKRIPNEGRASTHVYSFHLPLYIWIFLYFTNASLLT